jgi:hypothetical protein
MMKTGLIAMALSVLASAAVAQVTAPAPPPPQPPCTGGSFDDFDFWTGEWDVYGADGEFAGTNSIRKEEYGCLLVERWKSASGTTGQSYNFVDLASGKWRQVWVSAGATIDYSGGLDKKGRMILEGVIGYPPGSMPASAKFRGTWTPNKDGSVKQHFEQFDPGTEKWTDWFVGTYKRKSE